MKNACHAGNSIYPYSSVELVSVCLLIDFLTLKPVKFESLISLNSPGVKFHVIRVPID